MLKTLATVVASAVLSLSGAASMAQTSVTYSGIMVDCESYDIQPCYTQDDGIWKIVTSYSPYKAQNMKICAAKISAPCIEKKVSGRGHRVYFKSL